MGLFDKLFGGAKKPDSTTPSALPSSSPESPAILTPSTAEAGIPARRERSKPQSAESLIVPGDVENALLLNAINEIIQNDNPETRTGLYAAILQSELYLVSMQGTGEEELASGAITLQEGQQLSLATIRDGDGKMFLPAFTDVERLARSLPERGRYLKISAVSVCKMFLQGDGEGIVINPAQAPTGVITRGEAQALASATIPEIDENGQLRVKVPEQMKIAIGKPDVAPAESFLEAIKAEAANHPIVREVHVFKAAVEDQQPRLMIGLYVDDGLLPDQMHPSFEAIGKAAYEGRGDTEHFDMMPLNEQMIEAIRPLEAIVYSRSQEV